MIVYLYVHFCGSLVDYPVENGTKNYSFWTISSKIFLSLKIIKDNYTFQYRCLYYSIVKQDQINE